MLKKPHFIFDMETLGADMFTCAVIDCSYVMFDWDRFLSNPYTFDELLTLSQRAKLNVQDQKDRFGYKIDRDTVAWWVLQDKKVRLRVTPDSNLDITLEEFLSNLFDYSSTQKVKCWWSRSNTFDPVILYRITRDLNMIDKMNEVFPHWSIRDTRTFIDSKLSFKNSTSFIPFESKEKWESTFEHHNSTHDIIADILRLQLLTRLENDLGVVE